MIIEKYIENIENIGKYRSVLKEILYAIKCCVSHQLLPKQLGSFSGIEVVICSECTCSSLL